MMIADRESESGLPVIPLVDLGTAGMDALATRMPDKMRLLCTAGRRLQRRVTAVNRSPAVATMR